MVHKLISIFLDLKTYFQFWLFEGANRELITARLQRYPYWRGGHLLLARLALNDNDVATAYASVQAVLILGSATDKRGLKARHILARSYLARGQGEHALAEIKKLKETGYYISEVIEDEAACYMAGGDNENAFKTLSQISIENLSNEAKAALQYLKKKAS